MDRFSGVERVFGNTVSVVTTVQSAVFDPGAQKFWMACRNESPVGLGEYIEVDVDRLWRTPAEEYEKTMSVMPHYQPKNPALIEAVRHYRNAYQCYHTYNHEPDFQEKALEHIKKAIEVYPSDGHLWLQAGYVLFKMKKFEEAHFYLEKSKDCVLTDHVASVRDLYLARCLDLLGKRKEALQIYQSRSEVVEPKLRRAFRRGSRRTYQAWEIFQVQVDLQFPDTLLY
jgi:tetratricopeptide (TPR) repeat protein